MNKGRVGKVVAGAALVALACAVAGCPQGKAVFFTDPALEAAIRVELGLPLGFLSQDQLLELTTLDARGWSIRDLTGLENCPNLVWLDLSNNDVSDLTPLTNLENLTVVILSSNSIADLSPLAGLRNLDEIYLTDNPVADLQPLVVNASNNGLGEGDFVSVSEGSLSDAALSTQIPELRGANVNVDVVSGSGTAETR
jgi:hypothetical protein